MNEKKLRRLWEEHINRSVYRIIPSLSYQKAIKQGIDPTKNPFIKVRSKIIYLSKIIQKLQNNNEEIIIYWGRKQVSGSKAIRITIDDLMLNVVDFTPRKDEINYYLQLKGGALVANIRRITSEIISREPSISEREWKTVKSLNKWAVKNSCLNKVIVVHGSSKIFESALFHVKRKKKNKNIVHNAEYMPCPFGSYNHFKKVLLKEGWRKYSYLIKNKMFYLRVKKKIPKEEIHPYRY